MATYGTPLNLATAVAQALLGTALTPAKFTLPGIAQGENDTPPFSAAFANFVRHMAYELDSEFRARKDGTLSICVRPGKIRNAAGTDLSYDGAELQALTNNATNYVYIDLSGAPALVINTTGFPGTITTFLPVAIYVTSGGQITTEDYEADRRGLVKWWINSTTSSPTGTTGTSFTMDDDNAGAGANSQLRANRGSSDAEDAAVEWDETNDRWRFRAQHSTLTYAALDALALYISGTLALDSNGAAKVAAAVAGDGLSHSAGVLAVGVDGSTIEISSDALRVKDAGVTATKLSDAVADSIVQCTIPDASGASPRDVTVQVKDLQGNDLAEVTYLRIGVWQDANGAALATNATIAVVTYGSLVRSPTANKELVVMTDSSGRVGIRVTDGTLETVYLLAAADVRSPVLKCTDIGTITIA